ncbi:MAG: hypothetical protein AB7J13_08570, partial [Pyrinomonadaceae bacterium]
MMKCVLAIGLFFAANGVVLACMFGPPFATVCEKYANSEVIVVGKITNVQDGGLGQKVGLDISKVYKGKIGNKIVLDQPQSTCDWNFKGSIGETFLLYLTKNKGDTYHALGAGYGGNIERVSADSYWLENLPHSLKRNRISGTIQLYRQDPFEFIRQVSGIPVLLSNRDRSYRLHTDSNGVFQIWDIPDGQYGIVPQLARSMTIQFPLSSGDIEF